MSSNPFVSVVIPVYNDPDGIRRCLEGLLDQTYPASRYEILVVDNGSTDETRNVVSEFDVTLLVQDEIQGSYAARNRGLRAASGSIVAMIDADCRPAKTWLEAGVVTLEQTGGDLAGGRVVFEFSEKRTAAERFDASVNMRNDKAIPEDGAAKTANLFVRSYVVEEVGPFPEHLISGGDVYWTQQATNASFELVYAHEAAVYHEARGFRELLRKQYRVGRGQAQVWRLDDRPTWQIVLWSTVRFPLKVVGFLFGGGSDGNEVREEEVSVEEPDRSVGVYFVAVFCVLSMGFGRIWELIIRSGDNTTGN